MLPDPRSGQQVESPTTTTTKEHDMTRNHFPIAIDLLEEEHKRLLGGHFDDAPEASPTAPVASVQQPCARN